MYTYLYSHCVYTCIMDTYVSWIHMYTLCMYTCPLPQKKKYNTSVMAFARWLVKHQPVARGQQPIDAPREIQKKKTEVAKHWGWIQLDIYCD